MILGPAVVEIPKVIEGHQMGADHSPGSDRPPSGQGRRHSAKFTKLVNFGILLAQPVKADCGRIGDAALLAGWQPCLM